jgi:DNA-binding MarR family transcriptional regulator
VIVVEDEPLARLMTLAVRLVIDDMHERLAARGHPELRPAHGYVLHAASKGTTASEVAALLGMTKQGAAKVIEELEELGYVDRDRAPRGDRRARPVHLTRRGRAALDTAAGIQRAIEAEWTELAGTRAMAGLRTALEKVLAAAETEGALPPLRPAW